jgi:hypothetical protein
MQDYGALDDMFELADVARPSVRHESLHGLVARTGDISTVLLAERGDEVVDEQGDVVTPVAEWRNR